MNAAIGAFIHWLMYYLHYLHTTISHFLVILERFSCGHFHKSLIINTKNTQNYRRELPSFYPSIKSSGGGSRGGTRNCPGFPCKQIIVSLYLPPAARRAWSNGEALVAKGEMHKAGPTTGAPRFYFITFMSFMVRLYLYSFVYFRAFRG